MKSTVDCRSTNDRSREAAPELSLEPTVASLGNGTEPRATGARRGALRACATRGCDVATNGDTASKNACAIA